MTRLFAVGITLLAAGSLFGQRHGATFRTGGFGHGNILNPGGTRIGGGQFGYGNILFPGGVSAFPNGVVHPPQPRIGSLIPPWSLPTLGPNPAPGFPGGRGPDWHRQRTVVVPYAVPVWTGGWGNPYDYAVNQPASNVTVVIPQQPTPSVVINHNYTPERANPVMHDYTNSQLPQPEPGNGGLRIYDAPSGTPEPERRPVEKRSQPAAAPADDKPNIYLIALKDGTVRAAIGYWEKDGALHYVTPQGTVNRFSLEMLDSDTTVSLNRRQGLDWDLKTR